MIAHLLKVDLLLWDPLKLRSEGSPRNTSGCGEDDRYRIYRSTQWARTDGACAQLWEMPFRPSKIAGRQFEVLHPFRVFFARLNLVPREEGPDFAPTKLSTAREETYQRIQSRTSDLKDFLLKAKEELSLLYDRWNVLVPIGFLSPEILSYIFQFVAADDTSLCLRSVTHVCRHWRRVALGDPRLWTTIDFQNIAYKRNVEYATAVSAP
ncbi:hypothetical protein NM688_g8609 [Phlebia brevispora]|uniref:Uncharacterized protein n=1 Tax=Phlebia brevispora TaxID=194682 RepID=A0ACC1RRS1_9APHY|nr:hypothetical protein NM688_g8609 [Phlebia brevispora]